MALTYAAPTIGATAVAALSANTSVAAFFDGENARARNFIPPAGGVATPAGGTNATVVFPAVVSASTITDPTGGGQVGQVKLVLKPGTGDTVNNSPMTFYLDSNAVVLTVSGTF